MKINNPLLKLALTIIAIPLIGAVLLNITFILDALFQSVINLFFRPGYNRAAYFLPISRHILFAVIILFISFFIFKSKLKDLYKAVFSCVPMAIVLVTLGMFLYRWKVILYIICLLFYIIVILFLYKTKKAWFYYYSVSWVALLLLNMSAFGVEI